MAANKSKIWCSRGLRSHRVEFWEERPVLVRGDWKHASYRDDPKRYANPLDSCSLFVFAYLSGKEIAPGQCVEF